MKGVSVTQIGREAVVSEIVSNHLAENGFLVLLSIVFYRPNPNLFTARFTEGQLTSVGSVRTCVCDSFIQLTRMLLLFGRFISVPECDS